MDWKKWNGKKVFLRTNKGKVFQGVIEEVEDMGSGLIFISLIDKFSNFVTVTVGEIVEIKEDKENG